jgi:hypothetical protein
MTAKELLTKLDAIDGTWDDYDKEAIPLVEKFQAEERAEVLNDAADRACKSMERHLMPAQVRILRSVIIQEPRE